MPEDTLSTQVQTEPLDRITQLLQLYKPQSLNDVEALQLPNEDKVAIRTAFQSRALEALKQKDAFIDAELAKGKNYFDVIESIPTNVSSIPVPEVQNQQNQIDNMNK